MYSGNLSGIPQRKCIFKKDTSEIGPVPTTAVCLPDSPLIIVSMTAVITHILLLIISLLVHGTETYNELPCLP